MLVVTSVLKQPPAAASSTATPAALAGTRPPTVIEIPQNFESNPDYVAKPGTEVKGLGKVEQGFTFQAKDKAELVTGYLINLPSPIEIAGFKLELNKPSTVLDLLLLGFKAVGVNDRQDLPGMEPIGEESTGVTFWTTWQGSKLRVDAIVFRKGNTGAVAAVIHPDGQKPTNPVNQIALALEATIPPPTR
jgi:hypothetical protein